ARDGARGWVRANVANDGSAKPGADAPRRLGLRRPPLMALFQGLLFLVLGYGMLGVVYQSLSKGWLPFGANGFKGRLELRMKDQPFGYWTAFTLYSAFG